MHIFPHTTQARSLQFGVMKGAGPSVTLERKEKQSWGVTFVLTNANSILHCRRPLELLGEEKSQDALVRHISDTEWGSPSCSPAGVREISPPE